MAFKIYELGVEDIVTVYPPLIVGFLDKTTILCKQMASKNISLYAFSILLITA